MKQALLAALGLLVILGVVFYTRRPGTTPAGGPAVTASAPTDKPPSKPLAADVSTDTVPDEPPAQKEQANMIDPAAAQREIVKAHTTFAIDLYKILLKNNARQNEFLSPYSISTILGLTTAGARGRTAEEMSKVLHIADINAVNAGASHLTRDLMNSQNGSRPYLLSIANSLWDSSLYPLLPSFTELAQKYYDTSGVYMVDFRSSPEAAREKVNRWVEEQTMSRIKDLLPPGTITQYTALVLANAIYFKGDWQTPFESQLTRNDNFHVSDALDVPVSMMRVSGTWQYFEDEDVQVVSLPVKTSPDAPAPSMLLVVPRENDALRSLEENLTPELLAHWINGLEPRPGQVLMPKFTITRPNDLKDPLKAMGMADAFEPQKADFKAMATPPPGDNLYISGVYHKAFIDVNEQGMEAAAATAVALAGRGGPPRNPFIVRADHPFFFAIRVEPSSEILFMGRLTEPAAVPLVSESVGARRGRGDRGERGTRGERGRGERGRGNQTTITVTFSDANAAAREALELVTATLQDTDFVSSQNHPGLFISLGQIERAANGVISEDRENQAAYASATNALANSIGQGIRLSEDIAGRGGQNQASREKLGRLSERLRAITDK